MSEPADTAGDVLPGDILERAEQYQSVFEATIDMIAIVSSTGKMVEVNPAFCAMYGYTRDELIGMDATRLVHPDDIPRVIQAVREVFAGGTVELQARGIRKDGSSFYSWGRGTIFQYRGEPHFLGISRDVTDRVEAYELLEQRVEERTRELSTLLEISRNVASTLELQPLLDVILEQLKLVVDYEGATVMVVENGDLVNLHRRGPGRSQYVVQRRFSLAQEELMWKEIGAGRPVIIGDVWADTPFATGYRDLNGEELMQSTFKYVQSWMGVPLVLKDEVVGMLTLASPVKNYYTPHHASLATAIAQQAIVAIENARLYEQTVQRTSELSALLDVSRTVASTLELEPLLDVILDQLNLVADNDGITLLEVRGDEFVVLLRRVPGHEDQEFPRSYSTENHGPIWDRLRRGEVVIIRDVRGDDSLAQAYRTTVGDFLNTSLAFEHSFMAVPLMLKDRIIGLLGLTSARFDYYTSHQGEVALAIAQQAAVAIENARLYRRAQDVAVLEERQRLARELHDSVSQALYGIALGARTTATLLERDPSQAVMSNDYVLSLAETGLAEMRALIFELRPESLEREGLAGALQQQAEAVEVRHRIAVTTQLAEEPAAPLSVKEALYRIAQEAMNNAVKHAGANHITLTLEHAGGHIVLQIHDDGRGFDPSASFPGHLGLQSMRERAGRLGGTVELESVPGAGTRVRACIPSGSAG